MDIDDSPEAAGVARLRWHGADLVPPDVRATLLGPGAPFALAVEPVRGRPLTVFARRPKNLRALFDETAESRADSPLLVDGERTWNFGAARAEIDAIAAVLAGRYGIRPGDRVAIVSANSPEHGLVMWAVLTIGGVVASLNGWWAGAELRYGVALSSPALVTGDERRLARLAEVGAPTDAPIVALADLVGDARTAAAAGAEGPPAIDVDEDDPAVILFTSGTSGRPKGATLSHRNIINFTCVTRLTGAIGAAVAPPPPPTLDIQPASILSSPMFHVSGMLGILMSGPGLGTKLVFPPPGRWDEGRHLELTVEHRVTSWSGVPTQLWRVLRHPDFATYDLRSLRAIRSGGAPFPPELVRALTDALPWASLGNGYGTSETVGLGTLISGETMVATPEAVGPAQVGTEVEVRDPLGQALAEGQTGEILIRNASVFLGYWDDEEATAAALDDGWFRTGDFGRISGGMLYLDSRIRDLILRGGENIYPIEIEHRLVEHPDVDDAAVIGVDHAELGQEVKAVVVARAGSRLEVADVQRWVAETLAAFKVPAHVEFRDALPYSDTGKVLKLELERQERERATTAATST